jgi:hypothetical protein
MMSVYVYTRMQQDVVREDIIILENIMYNNNQNC